MKGSVSVLVMMNEVVYNSVSSLSFSVYGLFHVCRGGLCSGVKSISLAGFSLSFGFSWVFFH